MVRGGGRIAAPPWMHFDPHGLVAASDHPLVAPAPLSFPQKQSCPQKQEITMNRTLSFATLVGGLVLVSAVANARSVPACPVGHPLNPNQWACFAETYGGVQTVSGAGNNPVCNPNNNLGNLVGWEIGLPADNAGGKSATIGCNDPYGQGTRCQLLASQDAFNLSRGATSSTAPGNRSTRLRR